MVCIYVKVNISSNIPHKPNISYPVMSFIMFRINKNPYIWIDISFPISIDKFATWSISIIIVLGGVFKKINVYKYFVSYLIFFMKKMSNQTVLFILLLNCTRNITNCVHLMTALLHYKILQK